MPLVLHVLLAKKISNVILHDIESRLRQNSYFMSVSSYSYKERPDYERIVENLNTLCVKRTL